MAQIGTLTTGAGITTVIPGLAQVEEWLLIGDIDTANPLQGLVVEIGGTPYISIVNQAAILSAYAKWMQPLVASTVGVLFKIATGKVRISTTYRLTNNGATTPAIYAYSDNDAGIPFVASTQQINSSSYQKFNAFSALFVGTPANVTQAQVTFSSGAQQTLTVPELAALFASKNESETDGYLAGVLVIDNRDQSISEITLFAATAVTVMTAKIPDAAFAALKGK